MGGLGCPGAGGQGSSQRRRKKEAPRDPREEATFGGGGWMDGWMDLGPSTCQPSDQWATHVPLLRFGLPTCEMETVMRAGASVAWKVPSGCGHTVAGCSPCAGTGQSAGEEPAVGQTHRGSLPLRPYCPPSPIRPTACQGWERWRALARSGATTALCSVGPGGGAPWGRAEGSLGAELQTLPTSWAALVFLCVLFPVRFGLCKGSTVLKTGLKPQTQAHVREESGGDSVRSSVP